MKWISQHIWDFISRFRNDVYMEDLAEVEHEFSVMVGPDGKLTKSTHPGERSRIQIRNDEGATIPAGAPIYSKGEIGGSERIKVGICDSSDPAKMPCIGIVETELNTTDNKDGFATTQGVYNTNISGFTGLSEGDILYVNGGSAPHLTQTKPTNGDLIQNVGVVIKTNGTTCQGLLIAAIGRTNDVPWPLYVDHANQRVGIGIASPTEELHVVGDALVTGDVTIEGNLSISNSVSQTISFGDNDFLYLGDSNDLYLRHDGSNTTIYNSTGHLGIYNAADDKDIVFYCDDGSGGVTTYLTLDGGLGFIVADKKIRYKDNVEATFGDSGDARIYHTGSSTLFDNFTGNLAFTQNADDGDIIFNCDDGSGGTTAYFRLDGSQKKADFFVPVSFGTSGGGGGHDVTFFGATNGFDMFWDTSQNALRLDDGVNIYIGSGSDLKINHDGNHSYISQEGTGSLFIRNTTDDKDIIFQSDDGSGGLATYMTVDGSNSRIQFDANLYVADGIQLRLGTGNDLRLYHSTNSYVSNEGSGDLYIRNLADDKDIIFQSDDGSGGVETYFFLDGSASSGNPYTIFPDNSHLGFGSGYGDLQLHHDGTDSYIKNRSTGRLIIQQDVDDNDIIFNCDDGSGGVTAYLTLDGSHTRTKFDKKILIADSEYVGVGDGADLQIMHNGTNTLVDNITGDLYIRNFADDKDIIFASDNGSGGTTEYFRLNGGLSSPYTNFPDNSTLSFGGSNDLRIYHDGTNNNINSVNGHLKIAQYTDDSDIVFYSDDGSGGLAEYFRVDGGTGVTEFSRGLRMADSQYLLIGTGSDLLLYHSGTNSFIQNGNGDLYIKQTANDKDIIFQSDDGSGGVTDYIIIDGSQTRTNIHKNLRFDDIVRAEFGNSGDLVIIHDGTDSRIENGSSAGDLKIQNAADDKDILFRCDDGAGGVTDYFKLHGSAAEHNGSATTALYTVWPDNSRVAVGTSRDLQLDHNGTDSVIRNETGDLYIMNKANDKDIIFQCDDGSGGVATYITIDGDNTLTEFSKGAQFASGSYVKLLDGIVAYFGTGNDLRVWHSGSDSFISHEGDGDLYIRNLKDDKDILFQCDDGSGGTGLYFYLDGSAAKTIFSKNTEHQDSIKGQFGDSGDFSLFHNGTNSYIENDTGDLYIRNNVDDKDIIFQSDDGSGGVTTYMQLDGSHKRVIFPNDVQAAFGTSSRMVIVHDGTNATIRETQGDLQIVNTADDKDIIFQSDDGSGSTQTYMTIDGSDADVKVHTNIELERALTLQHASDPGDPASGHSVIWSDTSGNLKIKINVAGTTVTKTITTYE